MGKENGWFGCCVKRVFTPEAKLEQGDKKSGRRGRWLCGRIKIKHHCHSAVVVDEEPAAVVVPPERRRRILNDAKEEQRRHALAVAVATAAAAEAAIAAANAAAHIVRLTGLPNISRITAATKIQSAYRAHLARKALKALKGVVRLQAVIRGEIVRGRMTKRLVIKSLQCSVTKKTQPRVHQIKLPCLTEGCCQPGEDRQEFLSSSKDLDMEQVYVNRNNTRAHMKRYAFSHRERSDQVLEELITMKNNENDKNRWKNRRERRRNVPIQHSGELNLNLPRRSCCGARGQDYLARSDDASLPNSPVFPAYMAATESAKAKVRSMSTPRQRLASMDLYSVHALVSAYKPKHSSWSSSNTEFTADYP